MAHYELVVFTRALPGREEVLRRWTLDQHIADILRVPGITSARPADVALVRQAEGDPPQWHMQVIYEMEADDPQTVLSEITRRRLAGDIVWTDAIDAPSTFQILGRSIGNAISA